MALCLAVGFALPRDVQAMSLAGNALHDIHYAKYCIGRDPVRGLRLAMAPTLAWLLPPCWLPRQG
jgi:hypothetical protein